jgi:hypothetical protein
LEIQHSHRVEGVGEVEVEEEAEAEDVAKEEVNIVVEEATAKVTIDEVKQKRQPPT